MTAEAQTPISLEDLKKALKHRIEGHLRPKNGESLPYLVAVLTGKGERKLDSFLAWLAEKHQGGTWALRPRKQSLFGENDFTAANLYAELLGDIGREREPEFATDFPKVVCSIKIDVTFNESLAPKSAEAGDSSFKYGIVKLSEQPLLCLLYLRLGATDDDDAKILTLD